MVAIVLCAGFGTRLYPLTKNRPNALLEIAGKPVMDYQMEQLIELPDLREIHIVMNSRFASNFYRWWIQWRTQCAEKGITLRLHNDGSMEDEHKLGEVGDLGFLLKHLNVQRGALVSAGDNIYRFAIAPQWDQFMRSEENLVLAFPESHYQLLQQHTVIQFDQDHRLTAVYDQPQDPPAQWICPRLYFLQPESLRLVEDYLKSEGEKDRLAHFLNFLLGRQPIRVAEMPKGSLRLHINTRYMYEKANEVLAREGAVVG